jgi:hypothetical protein
MKVIAFKPNPRKPEQGFVRFEDETEAWTPEIAKAAELVGKELPDGWTLRDGPKGKQLLPPKAKGEGPRAAWANTEEGEKYVQERMDRRTALMQAVVQWGGTASSYSSEATIDLAEHMYAWLRKSVSEGPRLTRAISAAGESLIERGAQGPPSDTISGEVPDPLHSTEGASPDERREGDAGDNAVKPEEAVQTPGSPSRRRCLHTEGIKTITKETGGAVDVCVQCGMVVVA